MWETLSYSHILDDVGDPALKRSSAADWLLRRPQDRLRDDDALAVERHGGAAVELVAEFESLA
jgi:hypothetical protein